ncbi:hypothetical protein MNBD_NITROSPIRAE03-985, partial [hydrothermal vent metagenome]
MATEIFQDLVELKNDTVFVKDKQGIRNLMDTAIYDAVFEADEEKKRAKLVFIKEVAKA